MCVLQTQLTTATKATMMQTKSSSAASSFNNLMVSSMKSQCSGAAPAQPRRPAVSRHRQWPSSPPLSRLVTGWCNGTQKIQKQMCSIQVTKSRYKHKAARAEEFPCFLFTSIGVHEAIAASQKANLSLPRNVYCVRIEQGLPPRSDAPQRRSRCGSHRTAAGDF